MLDLEQKHKTKPYDCRGRQHPPCLIVVNVAHCHQGGIQPHHCHQTDNLDIRDKRDNRKKAIIVMSLVKMWAVAKRNANQKSEGGASPCAGYGTCLLVLMTQHFNNNACKCTSQNVAMRHDQCQSCVDRLNPKGLGWEFQFLVLISGAPIESGIPIPFQIPGIPVRFFFQNSAVKKLSNWNSDLQNLELLCFSHEGTLFISFCTYIKVYNRKHLQYLFLPKKHLLHLLIVLGKRVFVIQTQLQQALSKM